MITITKQIITPMLRLVLEWDAVVGAAEYVVKFCESGEDVTSETTTSTKYRLEQRLKNATWYQMQVVARDADDVVLDKSAVVNVWTVAQGGTAPLLRQAVYDAIENAGMAMIDDGYHRPRAWGRASAVSATLPAVEVGMPSLASTAPDTTTNVKMHTWQVPIRIVVATDSDPDRHAAAWLLFEMMQGAVDGDGIKLNNVGVMEDNWTWSASLNTKSGRGKTTAIEAVLTVPVRKQAGVILLPQPDTVPDEPAAPTDL